MPAPPEVLARLCRRLDPTAWDVPGERALLRLRVAGVGEWDLVVNGHVRELEPAEERLRPDARLSADRETWRRIGRDLRGGMNAFRRGRLQIRDNLHLAVGFLAATSGSTEAARLEMARVRTPLGHTPRFRPWAGGFGWELPPSPCSLQCAVEPPRARPRRRVLTTVRPSSNRIRARSFTRRRPTRTTRANGRRRSRATRFPPR
jgi:hypothetical protein